MLKTSQRTFAVFDTSAAVKWGIYRDIFHDPPVAEGLRKFSLRHTHQ